MLKKICHCQNILYVSDYWVKNDILLSSVMCSRGGRLWPYPAAGNYHLINVVLEINIPLYSLFPVICFNVCQEEVHIFSLH